MSDFIQQLICDKRLRLSNYIYITVAVAIMFVNDNENDNEKTRIGILYNDAFICIG